MPRVSVCIPVYNAAATLGRCLESVLAQGSALGAAEILVVDNCSDDGSFELARAALAGIPGARVHRNDRNLGRIGNWNQCLDLAAGEWVKFLMAGDAMIPGGLDLLLASAAQTPRAVFVGSRHAAWDGQLWPLEGPPRSEGVHVYDRRQMLELLCQGGDPFWALNGALMRLATIREHGLRFDEAIPYTTDKNFSLSLALLGDIVFVAANTYAFNGGITTRFHFAGAGPSRLEEGRGFILRVDALARTDGIRRRFVGKRLRSLVRGCVGENRALLIIAASRRAMRGYPFHRMLVEWDILLARTGLGHVLRVIDGLIRRLLRPLKHAVVRRRPTGADPSGERPAA